jgi:hypothetical protein
VLIICIAAAVARALEEFMVRIFIKFTALSCLSLVLLACSTKNYGRQSDLTEYEAKTMSCRELDLEQAKAQGFIQHVNQESEFDGRSVLSFLGDFGMGNLMEKDSALKSATNRMNELSKVRSTKSCIYGFSDPTPKDMKSSMGTDQESPRVSQASADQQIKNLQMERGLSYEEYKFRYNKILGKD